MNRKALARAENDAFGDAELAGTPTVGHLIAALPPEQREAYRAERRAVLARILAAQGLPPMTWRQYLERAPS